MAVGDAGEEGVRHVGCGLRCGGVAVGADSGSESVRGSVASHVDPVDPGWGAGYQGGDQLGRLVGVEFAILLPDTDEAGALRSPEGAEKAAALMAALSALVADFFGEGM